MDRFDTAAAGATGNKTKLLSIINNTDDIDSSNNISTSLVVPQLSPIGHRSQNSPKKHFVAQLKKIDDKPTSSVRLYGKGRRGKNLARHRGIYSELLGKANRSFLNAVTKGPPMDKHNENEAENHRDGGGIVQQQQQLKLQIPSSSLQKEESKEHASQLQEQHQQHSKLQPKVSAPFKTLHGQPPRKIILERKKRMFEMQDIDTLLQQRRVDYSKYGVDVNHIDGKPMYLPLYMFDDTEYECHEPHEWIELGTDMDTNTIHIEAKSLCFQDNIGSYRSCIVVGYDDEKQEFMIKWKDDDNGEVRTTRRIHLYFHTEDPFIYADRVANAHQRRYEMEAAIRYSLYIDSMPHEDIELLDGERINRILSLTLNANSAPDTVDSTILINEVNMDYARTMNQIVLDTTIETGVLPTLAKQFPRELLEKFKANRTKKNAPKKGMVGDISYNFLECFNDFCFNTLLTKSETINAISFVNDECLKVQRMHAFSQKLGENNKPIRFDEFEQLQTASLGVLSHHLKETWINSLTDGIHTALADVGKGWLNTKEQNQEVYLFSKLKKFMTLVTIMMQDSVRTLIMESLNTYVSKFKDACDFNYHIYDVNHVDIKPNACVINPLFIVSLHIQDDRVQYRSKSNELQQLPLQIFEKCLECIQGVPQLETKVMSHLFRYGGESKIIVPLINEPWIQTLYNETKECLNVACNIMNEYLKQYDVYNEFIRLDVDKYVSDFFSKNTNVDDLYKEIYTHRKIIDELPSQIPSSMTLGIIVVETESIRKTLIMKHRQIIQKELDYFANRARMNCGIVGNIFRQMENEIKSQPSNISELTELREYLQTLPNKIEEQRDAINDIMNAFKLLEHFRHRYSKELYRLHWTTFGWPKTINDLTRVQLEVLKKDEQRFLKEMKSNQEEFTHELMDLTTRIDSFGEYADLSLIKQVHTKVLTTDSKLQELHMRAQEFNSNEILFKSRLTDYRQVSLLKRKFEPYLLLWTTAYEWTRKYTSWTTDNFFSLKADEVHNITNASHKCMAKVLNSAIVKNNAKLSEISMKLKSEIEAFKPLVPLVLSLRNPGMAERHWNKLSNDLNMELSPNHQVTLMELVDDMKLLNHMDNISNLADTAAKEYQIELSLDRMRDAWNEIQFDIVEYKDTNTYVVRKADLIMQLLDEHIVMTQSMQYSPYRQQFQDRILEWDKKLLTASEVIEEWLCVQRQWLSLQPIFASPDINKQLPIEGKRFAHINKTWKFVMSQVYSNPDALNFVDNISLLHKFQDANRQLEEIQKKLSDYLDRKRSAFARFYFLSNDELLNILSQSRDPTAVQPHLKKCFENIDTLEFIDDGKNISAMNSSMGESIEFTEYVTTQNTSVEHWMNAVGEEMKKSVKAKMLETINDYNECDRNEWVRKWPSQCVLNGSQLHWTKEVENVLMNEGHDGIKKYYEKWKQQLLNTVDLVRTTLTPIEEITLGSLIVLDVHARDVLERLVNENVCDINEFAWICQMRYYMNHDDDDNIIVKMVQASFPYSYEYLGNTTRLVITPLTDRCYMTLMGAMQLHLGGAPAGPAGTGKTETVKDLAKAVAKQCVVFNCSDGLDYLAMGKFFKGLASSGAWACFDEFNRIDIEVLSVVAQQIMTIWTAVKANAKHFVFEGTDIELDRTCSVFITMNPGYAGRTELPDNLKALFRPVAMMIPNYALIAEILLYSYGFNDAKNLARKMVATFRLSSEQLSAQDHYDYGMRAVKTTIIRAGILKRESPDVSEDMLILRALRDVNVPKFLKTDLPLFEGIISDLFPNIERPTQDHNALENAIIECIKAKKLQPVPSFIEKCLQLYETTVVRHGLMVVGPTGGGKSSNINIVQDACNKLAMKDLNKYSTVKCHRMNPKAVTMGQLYGAHDENTHEWTDGILANVVRNCIIDYEKSQREQSIPNHHWIVFDGPVDALWIENMNTVLDDNKKLCLVSGEILQITSYMNMIFEVEDLAVASPATVSRCGMVYMEPSALGLTPLFESWLDSLPMYMKSYHERLQTLFNQLCLPSLRYLRKFCHELVPTVDNNLICSLFRIMDSLLQSSQVYLTVTETNTCEQIRKRIDSLFILSTLWSIGATTTIQGREDFDQYFRTKLRDLKYNFVPENGSVYDYCYDPSIETSNYDDDNHNSGGGAWLNWMECSMAISSSTTVTNTNASIDQPMRDTSEMIVPTIDSIRYTYMLDLLASNGYHVLFTGNTGTGKSVNVQNWLNRTPESIVPVNIIFSAATTANQTETMISCHLEKRRKNVFGPPVGKRYMVFVDDVNMPAREKYFAQPAVELLRQWMDCGGWYDRQTLQFNRVIDLTMVGAMGPTGGGRNPVTPRFLRHFNQIAHTTLQQSSLQLMFTTILNSGLASFSDDIRSLESCVVNATIDIYQTICRELLPTPTKSHYTFNLRDLSKVFQGLLYSSAEQVTNTDSFLRLWVHEIRRVFQDRLVNNDDRMWLNHLIANVLDEQFHVKYDEIIPQRLLFGDFMNSVGTGGGDDRRQYQEITDFTQLHDVIVDFSNNYADEYTALNLVMFQDAIEHVTRIARILREPKGNALLLGVGGSGRQSLTKLATYMNEYTLVQIEMSKGYGVAEWRDDLKTMLMKAGLNEEPTVFLFVDTQILYESFLEDVNSVLNSGDVPTLYTNDDMDKITLSCRIDCQRRGVMPTPSNVYQQYIARVRRNMHVVLCMSPLSTKFRTRLRMFPSLVNCCTIDWFSEWPSEALATVARDSLQTESLDSHEDSVVQMFEFIHSIVEKASVQYGEELCRHNYVTPTSYLQLLVLFKDLLAKQRASVGGNRTKLQNGLDTLEKAATQVRELQLDLKAKQPILEQTQKDVEEMMIKIAEDSKHAEATKEIVEQQEAEASTKANECTEIRDDAQSDLDKALPLLEQAVECLKDLKKPDLDEVRAMKKPPYGVILTLEAACIMLKAKPVMKNDPQQVGHKIPDYWETAQKELLRDPRLLLQQLQDYDKDNISDSVIRKISPYIDREDFQIAAVQKASKACTAVAMWVHAMYKYYHVCKEVEPKRERLRRAEDTLAVVMKALNEAKGKLHTVMERIRILTEKHERAVLQQENLRKEVELCHVKVVRANKLIGGLGGEKERWIATVKSLDISYSNLIGDVLIAAGSIAYLGAFTSSYRQEMIHKWRHKLQELAIPHTLNTDVCTLLADPVEIRAWNIAGLPSDQISIENAVIMSKSKRWPLLIDPQGQANRYIRNMGDTKFEEAMDVIKMDDKRFARTLEKAVRFGKWILVENVGETLHPILDTLLLKQFTYSNQQPHVKIGDTNVPYNADFRLFFTTRLANPHYSPETQVKVTLLNFTITPHGLEEQMLGVVVAKENPELEQKKNTLVIQNAAMRKELQDIEDQILKLLSETSDDPLEDEELIDTLAHSKTTAEQITERVAESVQVEEKIDISRAAYTAVAQRASILYFTITDLAVVDPMYQYSLQWFVDLFVQCISRAPASNVLNERLETLNNFFTHALYGAVCRSLFEEHKILFSLILTIRILQAKNDIDYNEFRFLITEASNDNDENEHVNPASNWLSESSWETLLALNKLPKFVGIVDDFFAPDKLALFRHYYESGDPNNEALPAPWQDSLDMFQRLLILKCLRPDKMTVAVKAFVSTRLGPQFIETPPFSIHHSFSVSTRVTPLIFILSRGADPASELYTFANDMGFREKLISISLGQGQGEIAQHHIEEAMCNGGWVLLQNCHLAVSWLPQLEKLCEDMRTDDIHPDFRLWLTSMPTTHFPVSILQNGVKMTNELPQGLRANLLRSYYSFNDEFLEESRNPKAFKKLLFAMCMFHAIALDRRKFGALGWNIAYEFTENDLNVCITQLREFIDMYDDIPYDVIRFLLADINYGGRVTDDIDHRTIKTILEDYINPDIMNDSYRFSSLSQYKSVTCETRDDYIEYIKSLEIVPSPQVFGLHENADITSACGQTLKLFSTLLRMLPKSIGNSGAQREHMIINLARSLLDRVPDLFDIEAISTQYPTDYNESMNTVVVQEAIRYNRLLSCVQKSIVALLRALKGEMVMTENLEDMCESIYRNEVPTAWSEVGYPSLMPLSSWITDLVKRVNFINQWIQNGLPNVIWISGLFFPQAFLTGTLQNYARRHQVPIDSVHFTFEIIDHNDVKTKPDDGCFINGLHMEGAKWDPSISSITNSEARELYTSFPIIWLRPKSNITGNDDDDDNMTTTSGVYRCPVYKTLTRAGTLSTTGHSTNFVMFIDIPTTTAPPSKWIKAGVSLFCALRH